MSHVMTYSITISGGIRALFAYVIGHQTGSDAMLLENIMNERSASMPWAGFARNI